MTSDRLAEKIIEEEKIEGRYITVVYQVVDYLYLKNYLVETQQQVSVEPDVSGIYYDKNGVEITDGCTIYNEWDRDKYHKIVKNENGELCFAIDMTVLDKRYATDRFWEVVNSR